MSLTEASLRKLRRRLPRGYQRKVAEQLGNVSRQTVGHVANGIRSNEQVMAALIRLAENHARERAKLEEKAKAAINSL